IRSGKYRLGPSPADPALPAASLGGLSAGARPAGRAAPAPGQARERLVLPEQLEALEEARRHGRAGEGEADRLKRLAGLQAEPVGQVAKRRLDLSRLERLHL